MIQIPATANVVIMHESISFNKGIDGTVAVARVVLEKEPMDGAFFVERSRLRRQLSGPSVRCGDPARVGYAQAVLRGWRRGRGPGSTAGMWPRSRSN